MASRRRRTAADDDVPRLPRARGIALQRGQLIRIAIMATVLVALIVLSGPCSRAIGDFVSGFDQQDEAAKKAIPKPGDTQPAGSAGIYVPLSGKTPEEQKQAIEEARRKAREQATQGGSGSTIAP